MSRFCSKDDQKSVVSLTRYYSTQHSKPAHTGASRGLLYCIVHSHAHVRLPLQHFGAIFFFFFFSQPLFRFAEGKMVEPNEVGLNSKNESNFPMRRGRGRWMPFAGGRGRWATQSARARRGGRRSSLNCVLWKCDFFCAVCENCNRHLLLRCVTASVCYKHKRLLFKKEQFLSSLKLWHKQADCCT